MSAEGHAILSDFETSKAEVTSGSEVSVTMTRVVVSGIYTAPEVLRTGGEHSRSSDMYSFGVLLAQSLVGDFTQGLNALLPRLGGAERSLVNQLLHQDPSKRPLTGEVLRHTLFRERQSVRTCCICMEDIPSAGGLECEKGGHFTCSGCLAAHVLAFSKADVRTLQKAEAKVLLLAFVTPFTFPTTHHPSMFAHIPTPFPSSHSSIARNTRWSARWPSPTRRLRPPCRLMPLTPSPSAACA